MILPQVEYQPKATGYANQFYFAKEFRRIIGKTPSEYRREGGGDEEIFTKNSFAATLMKQYQFGVSEEEHDWGLMITPSGQMRERK